MLLGIEENIAQKGVTPLDECRRKLLDRLEEREKLSGVRADLTPEEELEIRTTLTQVQDLLTGLLESWVVRTKGIAQKFCSNMWKIWEEDRDLVRDYVCCPETNPTKQSA